MGLISQKQFSFLIGPSSIPIIFVGATMKLLNFAIQGNCFSKREGNSYREDEI